MNKYMVLCLIFAPSIIMSAENAAKRFSDPRQSAEKVMNRLSGPKPEASVVQKGLPIPQPKKSNHRLTPEKSPRGGNSPYEFSPKASLGTVYYCGDFGSLSEYDFSPIDSTKR